MALRYAHHRHAYQVLSDICRFASCPRCWKRWSNLPSCRILILCDGQGLAHPHRFELACHRGLLTDIPCIGVAKSRLVGSHDELPPKKGAWVPPRDNGETIGAVLRTRTGVSPVYVSIGHRVNLDTAIDYTLRCTTRYRLPETTRHAHRLASG